MSVRSNKVFYPSIPTKPSITGWRGDTSELSGYGVQTKIAECDGGLPRHEINGA